MVWTRSLLFNVFYYCWLALALVAMLPMLCLPRRAMQETVRLWARGVGAALKALVGLDFEVRGRDNVAPGGAVYACKHQSAWETAAFHVLFRDAAYVIKKELFAIPLWGWYARKCRSVPIDRAGGAGAVRSMVRNCLRELEAGRPLVIFPEGTRVAPGRHIPYHPGVAALYRQASVPVVPVALNSGLFWGRRVFIKRPGVITLEFLPPMPTGLDRRAFMAELEARIEAASERLCIEAESRLSRSAP